MIAIVACATARADALIPFATDIATTMSFSETYTDTVFYDPDFAEYDTIPSTTMAFDAKASMTGVDPALFDLDASFTVDLNDLFVEFFFQDGVRTTANGRTTVAWDVIGTDPRTLDDVKVGSAWVRWSDTEIIFHLEMADDPDDFSIIAPDYAGGIDTIDQFPLIVTLTVGPYGVDGRSVYASGTAELYDKTVGSGDTEQTFTDLAKVKLSGFLDSAKPNVAILSPASHETVNDSPFTASGTADDNVGISLIEVKINDADFVPAMIDGLGHWSIEGLALVPGNNTITARATDQDGNQDMTGTRTFKFSEISTLTVTAAGNGSGKVSAPFFQPINYASPQTATVRTSEQRQGAHLVVTANPGADSVFDGWTTNKALTPGQAASPRLSVTMLPNMELTAHFLINPFAPVQGAYTGIATAGDPADRGFFAAKLTSQGGFSAKFSIGKVKLTVKGQFSNTGQYHGTVTKKGVTYIVDLTLNVDGTGAQVISGTIQGGTIDSAVTADLAGYNKKTNPAPQKGSYNMLIPAAAGNADANYPFGIGFGRVKVSAGGVAKFVGKLGDGSPVMAAAPLSGTGVWPFFASLYGKLGSIAGPVTIDPANAARHLSGQLDWFKPAGAKPANLHTAGFGGLSDVTGAKFAKPAPGARIFLTASNGAGTFSIDALADGGAALASDLAAVLDPANKLTVTSPGGDPVQNVKATIDAGTGLFSGSFENAGKTLKFSGLIVTPPVNAAGGMFVRGAHTGAVQIAP